MSRRMKYGFTIIELTLAMAFISVLLISIVLVSIQAGKMYNRGIILRGVNQAGRDIDTVMRQDFLQTDSRQIYKDDSGESVITVSNVVEGVSEPINGRLCLGSYSYVWNTPKMIDNEGGDYNDAMVTLDGSPINFVRVVDPTAQLCDKNAEGAYPNTLDTFSDGITHLLKMPDSDGEVVLAIHSLEFSPVATGENQSEGLYRINLTIGTSKMSEINTADQSCKPPEDGESNFEFCAINQFDTIVRTNG